MSDWRTELGNFLTDRNQRSRAEKEAARFKGFMTRIVLPAYNEAAKWILSLVFEKLDKIPNAEAGTDGK